MANLGFSVFDCDNHYYEALDAFTRHIEPEYAKRTMQWATIDGKQRLLVGGKINRFIPNPTFDPVPKPGALDEYFRGRNPKGSDARSSSASSTRSRPGTGTATPGWQLMDEQGMDGAIFLPTLGVGMEQALIHDTPALIAAFRAFNRWLDEDWGFAYQERIFAAPYITLVDPDNAVRELEWALERDARFVVMVGGPVITASGASRRPTRSSTRSGRWPTTPASPCCYHGGDTATAATSRDWGESGDTEAFRSTAFRGLDSCNATQDTIANLLAHGLFARFPNLRIATIETGSDWVFHLFDKLKKSYGQTPHLYPEDPRETFRRHVWVSPFYEDELAALRDLVGADRMLMGSDYPHAEGLAEPSSYIKDLKNFDFATRTARRSCPTTGGR